MNKSLYRLTPALLALAIAGSAIAQTAPGTSSTTPGTSSNPPVATKNTPPPADAPVQGANSFTESQARSRIEQLGYTDVKALTKDVAGIWRGKAMKNGQQSDVALDFRGNVVVGQK